MSISDFIQRRIALHMSEVTRFGVGSAIHTDFRRSRPRWFDGRFLRAADLNRESDYFLRRQADLAVAAGTGVVEGLFVTAQPGGGVGRDTRIAISRGHGMTFDGERVFLPDDVIISLSDIPFIEDLNVKLGLSRKPAPPDRSRTGIYIVALRPLEFTANPTASYPVDVEGGRTVQHGDVVEATAITLVPYGYPAVGGSLERRRSRIAHSVFVEEGEYRVPSSTLPLAMLEMRNGSVLWIDDNMVRREMGSVFSDVLGFGFTPRPLRRAHFKQYDEMIEDVVESRIRNEASPRFAAAEFFFSLPSAGRLPAQCVDLATRRQYFFPDAMDVEMSLIPEDELGALVEESLLLPPVPLDQDEEALATHSVMILLPVDRHTFYSLTREVKQVPPPIRFPIRPLPARFSPKDHVYSLRARLPSLFTAPVARAADAAAPILADARDDVEPEALAEERWAQLLSKQRYVWYVRRRNLSYKESVTGTAVHVLTREHEDETEMRRFQREIDLYDDFTSLKVAGSAAADLEMVRLLTIPKFTKSELLMRAALKEYRDKARQNRNALRERDAAAVSLRFADRTVGKGLDRMGERLLEGDREAQVDQMNKLAESLRVPELDYVAKALNDAEVDALSAQIRQRLTDAEQGPEDVARFILEQKAELEGREAGIDR